MTIWKEMTDEKKRKLRSYINVLLEGFDIDSKDLSIYNTAKHYSHGQAEQWQVWCTHPKMQPKDKNGLRVPYLKNYDDVFDAVEEFMRVQKIISKDKR